MSRNILIEQAITRATIDAGRPLPAWLIVRMASAVDTALEQPPRLVRPAPGVPQDVHMTPRQRQLAALFADGLSNSEIGDALHLTEDTVKTHARRTCQAMGAYNRAHAAALATLWGLATPKALPTSRKDTAA